MSERRHEKRPALGRGIDALLGESDTPDTSNELPIDAISPNPDQPRRHFNQQAIAELAESIATHGVLQPLIVERHGIGYRIIAGDRRFRAARLAGMSTVPAVVRATGDAHRLELALVENLQRADLNPVEEARGYRRLMELDGQTQEQVAKRVGKNRVTVTNALRLLKLPEDMLAALEQGDLTAGHARALLSVPDDRLRRQLFERIGTEQLSVRAAESAIHDAEHLQTDARSRSSRTRKIDPEIASLQQRLIEALGTKVDVRGNARRGRISVSYYSADDLDRISERITGIPSAEVEPFTPP